MSTSFQEIRRNLAEAEADAMQPDEWAWTYKVDVAALLHVAEAAQRVLAKNPCKLSLGRYQNGRRRCENHDRYEPCPFSELAAALGLLPQKRDGSEL